MQILIIDNDPKFTSWACLHIKKIGAKVFSANNFAQALKIATENSLSIVMVDLSLANEKSLELITKIKEIDLKIKIIGVTTSREEGMNFYKIGGDDILFKPTNLSKFIRVITNNFYEVQDDELKFIVESLSSELITIKEEFLSDLKVVLKKIVDSFRMGNFYSISLEANKLKTASMYGFENISTIAISLEKMAQERNFNILLKEIFSLQEEINSL